MNEQRSTSGDAAVLEAQGLERQYVVRRGMFKGSAVLQAVRGASFELHAGRTLAVVGESGCGKSTLARLVTLIEPASAGALTIDGVDVARASAEQRRHLRRTVQIVFQDPYGSLNPRKKIGAILAEPLRINTRMNGGERRAAVKDMLARVGLRPEHDARYPHMFSGGQRQRIAVARALMLRPRIVVLDEPVSALDVSIQAQVLNLLLELQARLKLTFLFVAHDLSVVRHISDRIAVMYVGQLVELAPTGEIFRQPQHPYTAALMRAVPVADPRVRTADGILTGEVPSPAAPPSGCYFHPRCRHAVARCKVEAPALREISPGHFTRCHLAGEVVF